MGFGASPLFSPSGFRYDFEMDFHEFMDEAVDEEMLNPSIRSNSMVVTPVLLKAPIVVDVARVSTVGPASVFMNVRTCWSEVSCGESDLIRR